MLSFITGVKKEINFNTYMTNTLEMKCICQEVVQNITNKSSSGLLKIRLLKISGVIISHLKTQQEEDQNPHNNSLQLFAGLQF